MIKRLFMWLTGIIDTDPVYSCDVYKKEGCSHVDGYLCDMKTCTILKEYNDD